MTVTYARLLPTRTLLRCGLFKYVLLVPVGSHRPCGHCDLCPQAVMRAAGACATFASTAVTCVVLCVRATIVMQKCCRSHCRYVVP
ncbi:hypothetical protein B296_00016421 [Ensete ventricosum]|uniref:Uncharacterized protein n=1 Tax=Ensete ventricosum TaxID=4639 RepID=A0A427B0H9_ENSVE|nr:hypothetical protein B296_00016421 [Ensete ventricosum]